jgi:hypothetical protein
MEEAVMNKITDPRFWEFHAPTHAPDAERHPMVTIGASRFVFTNEADALLVANAPRVRQALIDLERAVLEIEGHWTETIDNRMIQARHAIEGTIRHIAGQK